MLFENAKPVVIPETLLKNCLTAFNQIPNKKLANGNTTYHLASEIEHVLSLQEKDGYLFLVEALQSQLGTQRAPFVLVFWSVDHVQTLNPQLNRHQALQVLALVREKYGSSICITWETIEQTVEEYLTSSQNI